MSRFIINQACNIKISRDRKKLPNTSEHKIQECFCLQSNRMELCNEDSYLLQCNTQLHHGMKAEVQDG